MKAPALDPQEALTLTANLVISQLILLAVGCVGAVVLAGLSSGDWGAAVLGFSWVGLIGQSLTALDLITRPELLAEVRREFESTTAAHPYVDYLDAEARPPLSWHEEDMALFRPLLDAALGTSDM